MGQSSILNLQISLMYGKKFQYRIMLYLCIKNFVQNNLKRSYKTKIMKRI